MVYSVDHSHDGYICQPGLPMLMLKLLAQTGNNMFQYAACKTLADRKGYRLGLRGGKKGSLLRDFELDGETPSRIFFSKLIYALQSKQKKQRFKPARKQHSSKIRGETFDSSFFDLGDGTTVSGFFQSERYFNDNRENVMRWFTPHARHRAVIEELDRFFPVTARQRCCIHIRRSDYILMDKKDDGLGWVLPLAYYQSAMAKLPEDLFYVIISDAPDEAEHIFSALPNKYVSRNNAAVVDMFLLTLCKYNVIANSSFSWWGAWLNQNENKTVIAPRYHLGWPEKIWFPDHIQVSNWKYINVSDALDRFANITTIEKQVLA